MKKLIALITVFAFAVVLAGVVYADSRTPADKLEAARAYLKLLDQKIIRLRNEGKTALVKKMQEEKKSTIARMQEWKAELEAGGAAPVAPAPPPPPRAAITPAAAPAAGLFGLGFNTGYTVGYLAGKSVVVARGDLILGDALGIGPMLGLASDAIAWKIGLGGASGKDTNNVSKTAIPVFFDGIINIPAEVMGGVASYVGGGVNYVLYGNEKKTGSYGGQVCYGLQGDVGLGGTSYVELAYSVIRSGSGLRVPYSMKGIGINFGTQIVL